jgi:hypothetical protein
LDLLLDRIELVILSIAKTVVSTGIDRTPEGKGKETNQDLKELRKLDSKLPSFLHFLLPCQGVPSKWLCGCLIRLKRC